MYTVLISGELWNDALNQLSGVTHKWKWDYMDYLEGIKYRDIADVAEVIDYSKLSIVEHAVILPVPTDDYKAEYDAYCQRMGYTEEKMKGIRYKMTVYDEFREEYDYRKDYYGVEVVKIMERSRGKGAR